MTNAIRLKFGLLTIISVMMASNVITVRADGAPAKGPKLEISERTHDVGDFWYDSPKTDSFVIKNTGDEPLRIYDLSVARGLKAELQPNNPIAPNTSAKIAVSFDPGVLGPGPFDRAIFVNSNDPNSGRVQLKVTGTCKHYVAVSPSAAGFGKIVGDPHRERVLTINNQMDTPLELHLSPDNQNKSFKCELIETIPGKEFNLFVNTKPPFSAGMFSETIKLVTNQPKQPIVLVDAFLVMPEPLEVLPRVIPLRNNDPDSRDVETVQVVTVSNRGEIPIKVTSVKCSDPAVKTTYSEVYSGRQYRILVRFPANYQAPQNGADVLISTDDSKNPLLTVSIGTARRSTPAVARATPNRLATPPKRNKTRRPVLDTIGKPVPGFDLETTHGIHVSNTELTYHPATVLNFVAPNCGFCKKQIPKVEQIRQEFEPLGVRFVNVCQKMKIDFTPDEIMGVMSGLGSNIELAIDSGNQVGRSFKATAYPCLIIVRPDGIIDHVVSGNKKNIKEVVSEKLQNLLSAENRSAHAGG